MMFLALLLGLIIGIHLGESKTVTTADLAAASRKMVGLTRRLLVGKESCPPKSDANIK
jgi:hypothetical protein